MSWVYLVILPNKQFCQFVLCWAHSWLSLLSFKHYLLGYVLVKSSLLLGPCSNYRQVLIPNIGRFLCQLVEVFYGSVSLCWTNNFMDLFIILFCLIDIFSGVTSNSSMNLFFISSHKLVMNCESECRMLDTGFKLSPFV